MAVDEVECVAVAVWKEVENARAKAIEVILRLEAVEAKCTKAQAAGKNSTEAIAAHVEQVQEVHQARG